MELALALGYKSVSELESEMSVEEFDQWVIFGRTKLLPQRRNEYYMAQLTLHVSHLGRMWGGPAFGLLDFLFDTKSTKPKYDTTETGAAAIGAMVGGVKVIRLGQKRHERDKRNKGK